jgi:hypothetical protein
LFAFFVGLAAEASRRVLPTKGLTIDDGSCIVLHIGGLEACFREGVAKKDGTDWINMDTHFHSQNPSVTLIIKNPEEKKKGNVKGGRGPPACFSG